MGTASGTLEDTTCVPSCPCDWPLPSSGKHTPCTVKGPLKWIAAPCTAAAYDDDDDDAAAAPRNCSGAKGILRTLGLSLIEGLTVPSWLAYTRRAYCGLVETGLHGIALTREGAPHLAPYLTLHKVADGKSCHARTLTEDGMRSCAHHIPHA
eukprot:1162045-Pelagomonas_calceolata.AAC.3